MPVPGLLESARRISVLMTWAARRAFAEAWWLRGFAASGRGFHGETYDTARYPALTALLVSEFERVWSDLHPSARGTRCT